MWDEMKTFYVIVLKQGYRNNHLWLLVSKPLLTDFCLLIARIERMNMKEIFQAQVFEIILNKLADRFLTLIGFL